MPAIIHVLRISDVCYISLKMRLADKQIFIIYK